MSERNIGGRKRLVIILIAAIVVLAAVLGTCIYFFTGNQSPEPTEPSGTTGNVFVPDPTDPPETQGEMLFHCICGSKTETHLPDCDGSEHPWQAWTATDSLPTVSGKYYLTADIDLVPVADITTSETIYLDLNGFNINSPTRVYRMAINETEVKLVILDSVGTSVVKLTEHENAASFVLLGGSGNKTLTIYGGTIDGSALKADVTDKNGGVIRAATTPCTVNIHGGTIIGASSAKYGGSIYVENGTLNITGGEIKNGHALQGGNVFVKGAIMNMTGGKIYGGVAEGVENSRGGNLFNNASTVTISGAAEIFDGNATYLGGNVFNVPGSTVENTGKIYMTNGSDSGIYPIPDEPEDANHMSCICGSSTKAHLPGCDGTKYAWRPWKSASALPSTPGKYYLTVDVKLDTTVTVTVAGDIYLDLNGKTVNSETRVYLINPAKTDVSLTVLDSVGTGKVVMTKFDGGATFAAIGNTGKKVLTINGGTFDASAISGTANGGLIRVGSESSTLNVNAGVLIGAAQMNNGGAIHIQDGAFNMTGGEIKNGHANNGGNIFLNGGSFTMTGGKVTAGVAAGAENSRGGNIFNNVSNVKISGNAEVTNGSAVLGNNVFNSTGAIFENTGKVILENGDPGIYPVVFEKEDTSHMSCICGSKTKNHLVGCDGKKYAWRPWNSTVSLPTESGRYYLTSNVTLSAIQTIGDNANVYLDLNGKTIYRGTADRVFNLTMTDKASKLTVLDSVGTGKVELGEGTGLGSYVILNSGEKVFTMYGGTVNGAKIEIKGSGAIIRNVNQKVNIHGGTIIGGIAKGDGANSGNAGSIYNGGNLTITGGKISGGKAVNGGNIYNTGKLEISGTAEVLDGYASNNGHNICNAENSTFANSGKVSVTTMKDVVGIYPARSACICGSKTDSHLPGCDGTMYNWSEWTSTDTLPTKSGYYFLTSNVTLKDIQVLGIDANVYLDLNGKTIDRGTAVRVFNMILTDKDNSLTILDSVGTGKIELGSEKTSGALVLLNSGNKTFTMYGGTVNGAGITGSTSGGVIIRNIEQNVNIHGGTIIGTVTNGDGVNSGVGGTIWNSGKLTITAGEIKGGSAIHGGNIYNTGELEITGGKISGGVAINSAVSCGGNIYNTGKLTIGENATVEDGKAVMLADNIYNADGSEYKNEGTVKLSAFENATGVYPSREGCICGSKTDSHLPGCDGTMVKWGEWTKTNSLPDKSGYYYLVADVTLSDIQVLGIDANVYLDLNGKTINRGTAVRVFNMILTDKDNSLTILDSVGTGKIELGTEKTSGALVLLNSGNKTFTMYGGTVNGAGITGSTSGGVIIRNIEQNVNIHGGTIIGTVTNGDGVNSGVGGTIWNSGKLTITAGEIKGGSAIHGGNIYNAGELEITGGKISGGVAINSAVSCGGNIYNTGKLTIGENATVEDGKAVMLADNIYNADGSEYKNEGTVKLSAFENATGVYPSREGCICGSKTEAHLPGCDGTMVKWGEWTKTNSLPDKSGYYYLVADVTLSDIQVLGIDANVYLDLNGKTINRGTAVRVFNMILTDKDNSLTILDSVGTGKIELGSEKTSGALVLLNSGNKTFTMYGGTVNGAGITGSTSGGVIIRNIEQNVNIHGGTIIGTVTNGDGVNSGVGGTIWNSGKLTITAGEIKGGSAIHGGNIYNTGVLKISAAAKIYDGTARRFGYNIYNTADATFVNEGNVYLSDVPGATGVYPAYEACICGSKTDSHLPGCDGTKVSWCEWLKSDSLPTLSGNYFLASDVSLKAINNIDSDVTIRLDLNGKKITLDAENADSSNIRVYNMIANNINVDLTLLDSVGTGVVDLGKSTAMGAFALIHEAADGTEEEPDGVKVLTIYSGTIDGSNVVVTDNGNGGALIRNVNQTLNIHGGQLIGGTAATVYDEEDPTKIVSSSVGGTIFSGGNLTITGGEIKNGNAHKGGNVYITAGTFTMTGGTISGGNAVNQGGNFYINPNTVVTMTNGVICDGIAGDNSGGNIYIKGSVFNMNGGSIYGGTAQNGGNFFVTEGAELVMTGGKVYQGAANASNGRGGNIFAPVTGTITITGGEVYDGTAVTTGANIYCADNRKFNNSGNVYFTDENVEGDGIYLIHLSCICGSTNGQHLAGCDGTDKTWKEWTDTTKLPNTTGYWYLANDVHLTNPTNIANKVDLYIDLNGKTVYKDGASRVFGLNQTNGTNADEDYLNVTILDSVGNGGFDLGNGADTGAFVLLNLGVNKTFTMYGGTVNGANVVVPDNHGAVIRNIAHTVNIHGGTIWGGSIGSDSKFGGTIHSTGALNITGGTISGGRAPKYGGNIFIAGGSFSMTGGNVLDGVASIHGANICVSSINAGGFTLTESANVGFTDPALVGVSGVSAKYTVGHKLQNLDNDNYGDYVISQTAYGVVNTLTEVTADAYNGFTAKEVQQQTISGDCSTIVEVLYDRNVYTVTWVVEGETVDTQSVKYGAQITAPADPEKTNYVFSGWDIEIPATMPAENLTFNAKFVSTLSFKVTFDSNGGSAVGSQTVSGDTTATAPADPERVYSTFAGWYADEALETPWDFATPITADITLYAKWNEAVDWTDWTDETKLPDGSDGKVYYRLDTDDKKITVSSTITLNAAANIVIDLNNHTVTSDIEGAPVYKFASAAGTELTLSIWDSGENGKIELMESNFAEIRQHSASGRMGKYTLNIFGGTIEGGSYDADNGGVIMLTGTGNSVNMFGGTIKGANVGTKNGGAVVVNSDATFNMSGGVVYGGQAANGGNFIVYGGRLIVTGGVIRDGVATGAEKSRGGNIFCNATVVVSGGSIFDGTANSSDANAEYRASGNIFVGTGCKLLSSTNPNVDFSIDTVTNVYFTTNGEKDPAKGAGIYKAS